MGTKLTTFKMHLTQCVEGIAQRGFLGPLDSSPGGPFFSCVPAVQTLLSLPTACIV